MRWRGWHLRLRHPRRQNGRMSPKKGNFQYENTSSNSWFSGDMLVFWGHAPVAPLRGELFNPKDDRIDPHCSSPRSTSVLAVVVWKFRGNLQTEVNQQRHSTLNVEASILSPISQGTNKQWWLYNGPMKMVGYFLGWHWGALRCPWRFCFGMGGTNVSYCWKRKHVVEQWKITWLFRVCRGFYDPVIWGSW